MSPFRDFRCCAFPGAEDPGHSFVEDISDFLRSRRGEMLPHSVTMYFEIFDIL